MTSTIVEVTQKHIDDAIDASYHKDENSSICKFCIVTQALKDKFETEEVVTYLYSALIHNKLYSLSGKALAVTKMNSTHWHMVQPFRFTVTPARDGEDF
jgi:hypothetical protein